MDVKEKPINLIRETSRNILCLNRRRQKNEDTDSWRSLVNLGTTQNDVIAIINKLKTKISISAPELQVLQNALVEDEKYIQIVLSTHGALRGLVRELTGQNAKKQYIACGCLCNLALGDTKACNAVAKAAGVYLVATLDSLNTQLAVTSAWTVGNLLLGGAAAGEQLRAAGVLPPLARAARAGRAGRAALGALVHLARALRDRLRQEQMQSILDVLPEIDITTESSQLLFIITCHAGFTPELIPDSYVQKILEELPVSIDKHLNTCQGHDCCKLMYLIRVIANINDVKVFNVLGHLIVCNNLVVSFKRLLDTNLEESVLWLLGNMYKCCNDSVFLNELFKIME